MRAYDFFQLPEEQPGYVGSVTCMTSMCHGGADTLHRQYTIWKTQDPHSKAYATLTTAWSKRMGEALAIKDPATAPQCLACHAPLALVPEERRSPAVRIEEGVSCESCHGPASEWLLSHTRPDYTYEQRVATGLRDLNNLYVRAANCVACHQNLDPAIRAAGHPELEFEFTGLQDRQPRHWEEAHSPAHQWLVGQATALREMAYLVGHWKAEGSTGSLEDQCRTRMTLLGGFIQALARVEGHAGLRADWPEDGDWPDVSRTADRLARDLASLPWSGALEAAAQNHNRSLAANRPGAVGAEDTLRLDRLRSGFPAVE